MRTTFYYIELKEKKYMEIAEILNIVKAVEKRIHSTLVL
jgi:DNA-directed RNA polymerase specialized sigma24 family protein